MSDFQSEHPDAWILILQNALKSGKLPETWPEEKSALEWRDLVEELVDLRHFILRLIEGDLSADFKVKGSIAGSLKALQANLRHLTWQVQQVAAGDLSQKVEFMGDFSTAFNQMITNLDKARKELKASEERYRLLAENAADVIWTMDLDGKFTYISPSVLRLRGYSAEEALQQSLEEALRPASLQLVRKKMAEIRPLVEAGQPIQRDTFELEQPCKNGSSIWVEVTISGLYDDQGRFIAVQGASRDVTERRRAQQAERDQSALAEALRDTAAALNSAMNLDEVFNSLLLNISRVVPHDTVDILLVNPDGTAQIARSDGYQRFSPPFADEVFKVKLPVATTPNLRLMSETGKPSLVENLLDYPWIKTEYTEWARAELGAPILVKGRTVGFLVLLSDKIGFFTDEHVMRLQAFANQAAIAIEKARMFEQLNEMATIDSLVGIPNRRHFFNLAEGELMRSIRYNHPLSALMMDIDFFKQVNDAFGHSMGDRVLQEVVQRCVAIKRGQDLMGRYGGEEFAFILPETGLDAAVVMGNRLRQIIARAPFEVGSEAVKVTVSIGAACFKSDIPSARALLDRADQALYIAKHSGRNQVAKLV
jgi:diguanylate cyclase (GGDEF)-like protein/PAS domain S-box-containing protein